LLRGDQPLVDPDVTASADPADAAGRTAGRGKFPLNRE
jgi:hypothetical protein